jgi:alpha-amylase
MEVGKQHAGKEFIDALGNYEGEVIINEEGWCKFLCKETPVSV